MPRQWSAKQPEKGARGVLRQVHPRRHEHGVGEERVQPMAERVRDPADEPRPLHVVVRLSKESMGDPRENGPVGDDPECQVCRHHDC